MKCCVGIHEYDFYHVTVYSGHSLQTGSGLNLDACGHWKRRSSWRTSFVRISSRNPFVSSQSIADQYVTTWKSGKQFYSTGKRSEETTWHWLETFKNEDLNVRHHFALVPFLITSRTLLDSEHVRPVPSGSTINVLTLLSSTTIANLNEEKSNVLRSSTGLKNYRDDRTFPKAADRSFSSPRA